MPEYAEQVWKIFIQLSGTRQNGMTVNPIPFSELNSYCQLYRLQLKSWEIDAIISIDNAFMQTLEQDK